MGYWVPEASMVTFSGSRPAAGIDLNRLRSLRRLVLQGSAKVVGKSGETVTIPTPMRSLVAEIARNMEAGKPVSIVAGQHEFTMQRAANFLGVSRPFLIGLLEDGKLPFHMAGSRRRLYLSDLLAYKAERDARRHEAIKRLARGDLAAGAYDTVILPEGARDE